MTETHLIIGGESMLAGYLKKTLPGRVFALSRREMDISSPGKIEEFLEKNRVETVINCSGKARPSSKDPLSLYRLNAFWPREIARICFKRNIRFVFISTGRVFDGYGRGTRVESDPVHPMDDYGLSKYLGERVVENEMFRGRYLIFRIPLTYGIVSPHKPQPLVQKLLTQARSGERVLVSGDAWNSPSYAGDVAEMMAECLDDKRKKGCYHLANLGEVSMEEFVRTLFSLSGLSSCVRVVSRETFGGGDRQAENLSLASEKIPSGRNWKKALKDFVREEGS